MKYLIQIWHTAADRDGYGFSEEGSSTTKPIEEVISFVIEFYNQRIKQNGGSIEIIDSRTYDAIYHISEDSNHELKKVEL